MRQAVYNALIQVTECHGLFTEGSFYIRVKRCSAEGQAHELAHAVVIGWPMTSDEIKVELRNWGRGSDVSEIYTCAVEILAMRQLGMRIGIQSLAAFASKGMQTKRFMDALHVLKLIRLAMRREKTRRWADEMVAIVHAETEDP